MNAETVEACKDEKKPSPVGESWQSVKNDRPRESIKRGEESEDPKGKYDRKEGNTEMWRDGMERERLRKGNQGK